MQVKLKVMNGAHAGRALKLPQPKFLIGRSQDCHLRPDSDLISRHHCAVVVDGNYVGLRDFGSKNGTYVNDERVVGECELKTGDRLRVGPLLFEVAIDQPVGGPKRPAVRGVKEVAQRTAESARGVSDDDASDWIADPEESATVDATPENMKDTGSIKIGDTIANQPTHKAAPRKSEPVEAPPAPEEISVSETQAAPTPSIQATPSEKPAEKGSFWKRNKSKPEPGKLPTQPPQFAADSSSAAADFLKRLNRGK